MSAVAVDQPRTPPDRGLRYVVREQTPLSALTAILGIAGMAVFALGSVAVISAVGWTPSAQLTEAIESRAQTVVLVTAMALGLGAAGLGAAVYRRLPTRPSRQGAVVGIVLGLQVVVLGALYAWFRLGAVEIFARNFFEFRLLEQFWPRFLRAAGNTVILALTGEAIGIAIGLFFAVFAISSHAVVRAPARIYINFFRGTPLLWQLQFFFFGIALGLRLDLGPYEVAILVLGLNAGAYSAEIFRAGIQSIERSQFEAARSLGMSYLKALRLVILPQAFRRVIPPLTNEFVILIKDTSLVSILGLTLQQQELMAVGRDIYSGTFNATPFLASAAGYLAVTLPMIRVVTWLERRLRSGLTGIGA